MSNVVYSVGVNFLNAGANLRDKVNDGMEKYGYHAHTWDCGYNQEFDVIEAHLGYDIPELCQVIDLIKNLVECLYFTSIDLKLLLMMELISVTVYKNVGAESFLEYRTQFTPKGAQNLFKKHAFTKIPSRPRYPDFGEADEPN